MDQEHTCRCSLTSSSSNPYNKYDQYISSVPPVGITHSYSKNMIAAYKIACWPWRWTHEWRHAEWTKAKQKIILCDSMFHVLFILLCPRQTRWVNILQNRWGWICHSMGTQLLHDVGVLDVSMVTSPVRRRHHIIGLLCWWYMWNHVAPHPQISKSVHIQASGTATKKTTFQLRMDTVQFIPKLNWLDVEIELDQWFDSNLVPRN